MKIITWNVASIRSVMGLKTKGKKNKNKRMNKRKWFIKLLNFNYDIICFQETKLQQEHEEMIRNKIKKWGYNYNCYFNSCKIKKGLHGVAFFINPNININKVINGFGVDKFDDEGRIITLYLNDFILVNTYVPNSSVELNRLEFRLEWDKCILKYLINLKKYNPVIWTGDLNICINEIDLWNPKESTNLAGFTLEERQSFNTFLNHFIDIYRYKYPLKKEYSFWCYGSSRFDKSISNEGKGWRLDYFLLDNIYIGKMKNFQCTILKYIYGSDHCPVLLSIN
jgi:exodeoxyribonuclease-3